MRESADAEAYTLPMDACDLLITAVEPNNRHGVGIFLQRMFPDSAGFACIRTTSLYGGEATFGRTHHELCSRYLTLQETEEHLREILQLYQVRRILCVPYYREEFIHAILVKKLTGAKLCTFLMDDQNIHDTRVPDHWVADLLAASDLRLGISPEMCAAYSARYGHAVHLLPPVLEAKRPLLPCYWQREASGGLQAAMIGNIWSAGRFSRLRTLLRQTGLRLDWYGHGPTASWLPGTPEEWEADNLHCMGFLPEEDLVAALASYPFILVPSGTLDADDDNPAFSRLSLPSRLLFLHARTDTPVLVLGSPQTAAGRFVSRLGTGLCAPLNVAGFQSALEHLLSADTHVSLRRKIRHISSALVLENAGEWLWNSLAGGKPGTAPFQALFPPDYLEVGAATSELRPPKPRPYRPLPLPGEPFRDVHAPSFAFLRCSHLPFLAAASAAFPDPDTMDQRQLHDLVAGYLLTHALPEGGDVLYLGDGELPLQEDLPRRCRFWRIKDLPAWQRAGYAGDPSHLVALHGTTPFPPAFPQFDAILSTSWCGRLGDDPHHLEGLSLFLDACTRPGGFNFHLFTAFLNAAYFWVGPAHPYLRNRFLKESGWPDLDEMLACEDLFVISEAAYNRNGWSRDLGKSYAEIGRPLSLALHWRKDASPSPQNSFLA